MKTQVKKEKDKKRFLTNRTILVLIAVGALLIGISSYADANIMQIYGRDGRTQWFINDSINATFVGIGTATPNATLDVNGTIFANGSQVCTADNGLCGVTNAAPDNAQYITLATNPTLTNERVITPGAGIVLEDTGANGNLRVNVSATACTGNEVSRWTGTAWSCFNVSTSGGNGTITGVVAGGGLIGGGYSGNVTVAVNYSVVQTRVNETCSPGSSIRSILENGSVVCELDSTGSGTVTSVGIYANGSTSVSVSNSPITSSGYITLSFTNASLVNDGLLRAVDFINFYNKGVSNLTLAEVVASIGNWSGNISAFYTNITILQTANTAQNTNNQQLAANISSVNTSAQSAISVNALQYVNITNLQTSNTSAWTTIGGLYSNITAVNSSLQTVTALVNGYYVNISILQSADGQFNLSIASLNSTKANTGIGSNATQEYVLNGWGILANGTPYSYGISIPLYAFGDTINVTLNANASKNVSIATAFRLPTGCSPNQVPVYQTNGSWICGTSGAGGTGMTSFGITNGTVNTTVSNQSTIALTAGNNIAISNNAGNFTITATFTTYPALSGLVTNGLLYATNSTNATTDSDITWNPTTNVLYINPDGRFVIRSNTTTANAHTVDIFMNTTGATDAAALQVTSNNYLHSAALINSNTLDRGALKIEHEGNSSTTSAAALSLLLKGVGTAAQGIFLDSDNGTTGRLMLLKNNNTNKFEVKANGDTVISGKVSIQDANTSLTLGGGSNGELLCFDGQRDWCAVLNNTGASTELNWVDKGNEKPFSVVSTNYTKAFSVIPSITNGNERVYLATAGGRVGINTTAPVVGTVLDVSGNARVAGQLNVTNLTVTGLTAANCDLKADSATGNVYCGTDQGGAGGSGMTQFGVTNGTSNTTFTNQSTLILTGLPGINVANNAGNFTFNWSYGASTVANISILQAADTAQNTTNQQLAANISSVNTTLGGAITGLQNGATSVNTSLQQLAANISSVNSTITSVNNGQYTNITILQTDSSANNVTHQQLAANISSVNSSVAALSTFAQTKGGTGTATCAAGFYAQNVTVSNSTVTSQCAPDQSGSGTFVYSANFNQGLNTTSNTTFNNVTASIMCIGTDCRTSWPTGSGLQVTGTPQNGYLMPAFNATHLNGSIRTVYIDDSGITTTGSFNIRYNLAYGSWFLGDYGLGPNYMQFIAPNASGGFEFACENGGDYRCALFRVKSSDIQFDGPVTVKNTLQVDNNITVNGSIDLGVYNATNKVVPVSGIEADLFAQNNTRTELVFSTGPFASNNTRLQYSWRDREIYSMLPATGTTAMTTFGFSGTQRSNTTISHVSNQIVGYVTNIATAATAFSTAAVASPTPATSAVSLYRGSNANTGGFYYSAKIYTPDASYGATTTGVRVATGVTSAQQDRPCWADNRTTTGSMAMFFYDTNSSNSAHWSFVTSSSTVETAANTTMTFTPQNAYLLEMACQGNCGAIQWKITNLNQSIEAAGTVSTNLPATNTAMGMVSCIRTHTTTARNLQIYNMYAENNFRG